jgi:hypothetical protein
MEDFIFDYSDFDFLEMKRLNITMMEIQSVFQNPSSFLGRMDEFQYFISFSSQKKFIQIAFEVSKNSNFDVKLLQIDLPYEKDIKINWCGNQ